MAGATRRILRHYGQCKLEYEKKTEIKIQIEIEIAIGGIEAEIEIGTRLRKK